MSRPLVIIFGGNSDIGQASAYQFAQAGYDLILSYRRIKEELHPLISDLRIRYQTQVTTITFEAGVTTTAEVFTQLPEVPMVAIMCIGSLLDNDQLYAEEMDIRNTLSDNFTGLIPICNALAEKMANRGEGTLIGVSSVAGERGRASNYLYGAAKAGFTSFLSGLRQRTKNLGVKVITVKPGFVRTKMIAHLTTPAPLTSTPEQLAKRIFRAYQKQQSIIYSLPLWRFIMWIIRLYQNRFLSVCPYDTKLYGPGLF